MPAKRESCSTSSQRANQLLMMYREDPASVPELASELAEYLKDWRSASCIDDMSETGRLRRAFNYYAQAMEGYACSSALTRVPDSIYVWLHERKRRVVGAEPEHEQHEFLTIDTSLLQNGLGTCRATSSIIALLLIAEGKVEGPLVLVQAAKTLGYSLKGITEIWNDKPCKKCGVSRRLHRGRTCP